MREHVICLNLFGRFQLTEKVYYVFKFEGRHRFLDPSSVFQILRLSFFEFYTLGPYSPLLRSFDSFLYIVVFTSYSGV